MEALVRRPPFVSAWRVVGVGAFAAATALGLAALGWAAGEGNEARHGVAASAGEVRDPAGAAFAPDDPAERDARAADVLLPPVGVVAEPEAHAVHLAWLAAPGSTVSVDGYEVLWWPAAEPGFAFRERLTPSPISQARATIPNLAQDTAYYVSVRAVTATPLPELERRGDWSFSRLSRPLLVRTRPNPTLRLLTVAGTSDARAVFALDYLDTSSGRRHRLRAITQGGEVVRARLVVEGESRNIATRYRLERVARVPHWPLAEPGDGAGGPAPELWHELRLPGGEAPRDRLDREPFDLQLPRRVEPAPHMPHTRPAAVLRHIETGEELILVAGAE